MTVQNFAIEQEVLSLLRRERQMSPAAVIQAVLESSNHSISDMDVRRAIWRLISYNEVELSAEQLLHAAGATHVPIVGFPRRT